MSWIKSAELHDRKHDRKEDCKACECELNDLEERIERIKGKPTSYDGKENSSGVSSKA